MPSFRKKPVTIEAIQWDGTDESSDALLAMGARFSVQESCPPFLTIETLEGKMGARVGDYIIRGVAGEFYPCKPAIFAATYESVPPAAPEPSCKICGDRGFYSVPQVYTCDHGTTPAAAV